MESYRPAYREALAASLAILALYVVTLAPSAGLWDASEYTTTGHILGIPHPPGNPLFVVIAKVWSLLLAPLGLSVAVRINLLAAVTSSAASGFLYLVVHRVLWGISRDRWFSVIGAGASVLIGGTAYTVWHQSNVNEKVYTVSVMIVAAVSWLAVRWLDTREEEGSERYLLIALYLMVLGSTNHLMSVLPGGALALLVLLAGPAVLVRGSFWVRAIPLAVIGISFSFFLPIRAAQDPVINEGDPVCESAVGAAVAVYTFGKRGCQPLAHSLSRLQYLKPPLTDRQAPLADQMLNYFQYFDWQWSRGATRSELPGNIRLLFTALFLGLGVTGFLLLWQTDRALFAYMAALMVTLSVALVFYLNFKYGYSLGGSFGDRALHEVRERDYFFIAGFLVWGAMAGLGLAGLWRAISNRIQDARRLLLAAPVLLVAFIPMAFNWSWSTRSGDYAARDWAYDLLASVEPYAILFTHGDNDTFPLWYVQEVEEFRRDVTVIVVQYLYTPWYIRQLRDLTQPENQRLFLPEQGHGLFGPPPQPPSRAIVRADHDVLDSVVGGRISSDLTVPLGQISVRYEADTYLDRGVRLALNIIHDSIEERPIYFSSNAGLMSDLGLRPWGVRHGLPSKLELRNLEEEGDSALFKTPDRIGGDWFDMDRALALVQEVYQYRGLKDRNVWADHSTLNIPWHFFALHLQLAESIRVRGGDSALADSLAADADRFRVTADGGVRGRSLER